MVLEPVLCPDCGSADVVRHGRYQYKSTLIGKSEFRRVDSGRGDGSQLERCCLWRCQSRN
jgi:hypothetical protein